MFGWFGKAEKGRKAEVDSLDRRLRTLRADMTALGCEFDDLEWRISQLTEKFYLVSESVEEIRGFKKRLQWLETEAHQRGKNLSNVKVEEDPR
jgi:predicted nuclease with TOPRIM domain